jgi:hypothetical protein
VPGSATRRSADCPRPQPNARRTPTTAARRRRGTRQALPPRRRRRHRRRASRPRGRSAPARAGLSDGAELERPIDPPLDERRLRAAVPHGRPERCARRASRTGPRTRRWAQTASELSIAFQNAFPSLRKACRAAARTGQPNRSTRLRVSR